LQINNLKINNLKTNKMKYLTKNVCILLLTISSVFVSCSNNDDGYGVPANPEPTEANTYSVVNSGATAYVFNGEGLTNASNPDFTLKRGSTYTFNVEVPAHPFLIKSVEGTTTANQYNSGVSNNGAVTGTITFTVPSDAPNTLYYNCEFHGSMTGTLSIVD
jgi:hypothetical protein